MTRSLLALALALAITPALAETVKKPDYRSPFSLSDPRPESGTWAADQDDNLFVAGFPSDKYEIFPAHKVDELAEEKQWQLNWSMSACVQMLMANQDLYVEQPEVMGYLYGQLYDKVKPRKSVRRRLDGWKPEKKVRVSAREHQVRKHRVAHDLERMGPLLVGLEDLTVSRKDLPVILLQVTYSVDYFNKRVPSKVLLVDPWPDGREHLREMSWYDFENAYRWAWRVEVKGR